MCMLIVLIELRFGVIEYKLEELIFNVWRVWLLLKYRYGWDWYEVDVMFISKGKMRKEVRRNYLIVKIFIVKDWLFIRDFVGFCVI